MAIPYRARFFAPLLMCCLALAQEAAPQQPKQQRRRRPQWKASLSLPKDLWRDVTAQTIGETAE